MRYLYALFFVLVQPFYSQEEPKDSTFQFRVSGFIDAFYSYDFKNPKTQTKLPLYSYNRQNEFNINLALFRVDVNYNQVYGKLSIHSGTYVDDNYSAENLKLLNEAYIGLYLNKSKKTILEVGILPSYIGFETANSNINLTSTRSLLAEASPYFMTGLKINHIFSSKVSLAFLTTNGWQKINKPRKDVAPSIGTQFVYRPKENILFNWSTYLGKEIIDTNLHTRFFNNFYLDKKWNDKWHSIVGFDIGFQDISNKNTQLETWFSQVLITHYSFNKKFEIAHRIEYFQDKYQIIMAQGNEFKTIGNSINLDFLPISDFKIRTEVRLLNATENVINNKKNNFSITTSFSYSF